MSQYAKPIIVPKVGNVQYLDRLSLSATEGQGNYSEDWLQNLLFQNPDCLPVSEIDPGFERLIPVCRELNTPAGPIDIVYVTPEGRLVLVETKLWRNPEARRTVVAQILDYAKELAQWEYEDLLREVSKVTKAKGNVLYDVVNRAGFQVEEQRFVDAIARTLTTGKFMLLIVGDGIREGVNTLTDFLDRFGSLQFSFGLIETGMFRFPNGDLLVQPRILAKTMIMKRTVVTVESPLPARVEEQGEGQEQIEDATESETARFYTNYWTDFLRNLKLDDTSQPPANVSKTTNIFFGMPPSGSQAWVSAYFSQSKKQVGVYLRFKRTSFGQLAFRELQHERDAINRELGDDAIWREDTYSISCKMNYQNLERELHQITEFFSDKVNRFVNAFRPRLEKLAKNV